MSRAERKKPVDHEDDLDAEYSDGPESESNESQRKSEDIRRLDQETLEGEEEAERLLTSSRPQHLRQQYRHAHRRRRSWRGWRCCGLALVHIVISLLFLVLLFGAWSASRSTKSQNRPDGVEDGEGEKSGTDDQQASPELYKPKILSNGTHTFSPTTLLISLDGFRADFLHRNITPELAAFQRSGISPRYMTPSFPSLTFPNHYTLVTGLYPESHGIVGNSFWDPVMQKEFYYTDPERSLQPEWWDAAEPIWVTAEKAGVRTGVHMWPGSEVPGGIGGVQASYVDKYNGNEALENKVNRILGWLDLPGDLDERSQEQTELRPQLIAAYVPNVDVDGHMYGPNSTYIRSTIAEVDAMLSFLFAGLEARNLSSIVNIIIVSDHGMATTSTDRLLQLDDMLDVSQIEHIDGWPLYGLRPYDQSEEFIHKLFIHCLHHSQSPQYAHAFETYRRDRNMPERYHFSSNPRIAPLWLVPKAGWAIVTKADFDVEAAKASGEVYHPRGLHGYDPEDPLMRAIFVARGPAFPHVAGSALAPFQNIEVYNIVCDSLGIRPVENNGTLRLPLRPDGVHNWEEIIPVPYDPQDDSSLALPYEPVPGLGIPGAWPTAALESLKAEASAIGDAMPNLANRPDLVVPTEGAPAVSPTSTPEKGEHEVDGVVPARPVVHDGMDEDDRGKVDLWFEWVSGKLDAIKGWAFGLFGDADDTSKEDKGDEDKQTR